MSEPADELLTYPCPGCGAAIRPQRDRPNLLICPACRCESFVPAAEDDAEDGGESAKIARADEIDAARIRRLAIERRSINRTASYFIVAAGVCLVAIAQLAWMTIQHVRAIGWTPRPIGYLLFIVLAVWGAWYFGSRAMALHREAKASVLPEPTTPPDFSTLDDGSKHWKNLEDVR
jgi:hypothetical protein